jgi:hypothetical protein
VLLRSGVVRSGRWTALWKFVRSSEVSRLVFMIEKERLGKSVGLGQVSFARSGTKRHGV